MPRMLALPCLIALTLLAAPAPAAAPAYAASSGFGETSPELAMVLGASGGGELSQADRDAAVKYLQETQQKFLASIEGLSDAQWKFKPGPDRWSVAEVAEHIALSETLILQLVSEKIAKGPAVTKSPSVSDQNVIDLITNRSQKAQAPEMLRPTNKWATRDALTKDFQVARERTITYVKTTSDDLRNRGSEHPAFKQMLDGHHWILLLAAHSARHTAQIEEVKASAGYPK